MLVKFITSTFQVFAHWMCVGKFLHCLATLVFFFPQLYLSFHFLLMLSIQIRQSEDAFCPGHLHDFLDFPLYAGSFQRPFSPNFVTFQFLPGFGCIYCLPWLLTFCPRGQWPLYLSFNGFKRHHPYSGFSSLRDFWIRQSKGRSLVSVGHGTHTQMKIDKHNSLEMRSALGPEEPGTNTGNAAIFITTSGLEEGR